MESTKFVVFSDLHAHTHKRYARYNKDGVNTRLQVALDVLKDIEQVALEEDCQNIIFAGDLFEAKGRVPVVVMNHVFRVLQGMDKRLRFFMIPGNHDYAVRSGAEYALEVFSSLDNFIVVGRPSKMFPFGGGDIYVHCIPFSEKLEKSWFEPDENWENVWCKVCVFHGLVGDTMLSEAGITTTEAAELGNLSYVPREWLEPFDLVVAGHVHYPQWIEPNILIPGQPWQQHAHEASQKRGFWVVSVERGGKVRVELKEVRKPCFLYAQVDVSGEFVLFGDNCVDGHIVTVRPINVEVANSVIKNVVESLYKEGANYVEVLPPEGVGDGFESNAPRLTLSPYAEPASVLDMVLRSDLLSLDGFEPEDLIPLGQGILAEAVEESES